jgi:hypothetical protein
VAVLSNPYFQVTSRDGKFSMANVPPGDYTLVAWHEVYGMSEQAVTIGPSESRTVDFAFKATSTANVRRAPVLVSELLRP